MDIEVFCGDVFDLPSTHRVNAILHDGARDLRAWSGPGCDKRLARQHGRDLDALLDSERKTLEAGHLALGGVHRLHPGKLRCDYLLWLATREPERGVARAPAPDLSTLAVALTHALEYVATRGGQRVAFAELGEGPDAPKSEVRLEALARASAAFAERRASAGQPAVVETVLLCVAARPLALTVASRLRAMLRDSPVVGFRSGLALPGSALGAESREKSGVRASKLSASGRRNTSASGGKSASGRRGIAFDDDDLARGRASAVGYQRDHRFSVGDWVAHPKFGLGRVQQVEPEGRMRVLFEDKEERRLLHNGA